MYKEEAQAEEERQKKLKEEQPTIEEAAKE